MRKAFSNKRGGKIKARVFALILLLFSCSMIISSYRSLSRNFSGVVIRKTASAGLAVNQYHLFLLPEDMASQPDILTNVLADESYALRRVGVSSLVYESAQPLEQVEKTGLSIFIRVGNVRFIDLGFSWFMMGIAGIAIAIWMHLQTVSNAVSSRHSPGEELSIPGLD